MESQHLNPTNYFKIKTQPIILSNLSVKPPIIFSDTLFPSDHCVMILSLSIFYHCKMSEVKLRELVIGGTGIKGTNTIEQYQNALLYIPLGRSGISLKS